MSYYPILSAPGCDGYTTLSNYPPNNWEIRSTGEKLVHVTWLSDEGWRSEQVAELSYGHVITVERTHVENFVPDDCLPLLSITTRKLPKVSEALPRLDPSHAVVPVWRATLSIKSSSAVTSYQGEVDPFPESASLLTFCPFLQFGEEISNYLILLNVEASPSNRTSKLEVYNSIDARLHGEFEAKSNSLSIARLDELGFGPLDLPFIVCRNMAGIPLYFSKTSDGSFLSLEHTHPPASLVIHGKRWQAQKKLKDLWYARIE